MGGLGWSSLREGHALLALVLAAAVLVAGRTHLVGFQEQHLRDALVGVDLCGQRRGIGKLERHMALPLRFQRRDIDDDAAARVSAFAEADRQHVAGDAEVFDGARQRERVRRDDAAVAVEVHEVARIEILGIDDGGIDVGEDLELARAAYVVAVTGGSVRHDAAAAVVLDLAGLERLDHAALLGHAADPVVALDAHGCSLRSRDWDLKPESVTARRAVTSTRRQRNRGRRRSRVGDPGLPARLPRCSPRLASAPAAVLPSAGEPTSSPARPSTRPARDASHAPMYSAAAPACRETLARRPANPGGS